MKYLDGQYVALEEMLDARERRAHLQQTLIDEYNLPIISFTLNIVGAIKVFPLSKKAYSEGVKMIKNYCKASGINILHCQEILEHTGYECLFVVSSNAIKTKSIISKIETSSSLGRLFDIDVIDTNGQKISRSQINLPERKCLLCDNQAFVCSRSRAHSVDDILSVTIDIISDFFVHKYANDICQIATRALLYEVSTTPKAGLVDADNTGAHSDMDISTFEKSAITLAPYFKQFVLSGTQAQNLEQLFFDIRQVGISAEIAMLSATGGVNTHKGIIFSLGIVCAALGYIYQNENEYSEQLLRDTCKKMVVSLERDFDNVTIDTAISHGEKVYANYGIRGIRGEAIDGFSSVFDISLPFLKKCLDENFSMNDAAVLTILHIIANIDDTNIITRSDYQTLKKMQEKIAVFLENPQDYLNFARELDLEFIELNISAGGSADLLALTLFMYFFEKEI